MQSTPIEWATASWNPTRGCSRVSPGCGGPHGLGGCYAEKIAARFDGPGQAYEGLTTRGRWNGRLRLVEEKIGEPLRWRKPQRIFVNSMSDLFHENLTNHEITRVFATMARADWHTFLVLTKRHERLAQFFVEQEPPLGFSWPLPNVWLGVSVENQEYADERIPALLATPAAIRFLSIEPLIGPVDLYVAMFGPKYPWCGQHPEIPGLNTLMHIDGLGYGIDWVIVGGESGPNARPMHPDWARSLRDQCIASGVPFHFKQWGEWAPRSHGFNATGDMQWGTLTRSGEFFSTATPWNGHDDDGHGGESVMVRVGKKAAGRLLDGVTWDQFPTEVPHA